MNTHPEGSGFSTPRTSFGTATLKERLTRGEAALGTISLLPEPALAEIAGASGADFYILDTEHLAIDGQAITHVMRAGQSAGVSPLIRVRNHQQETLTMALDTGAEGILVPFVENASQAKAVSDFCLYPPRGTRTICSASRACVHGAMRGHRINEFLDTLNENLVLVALLETPESIANSGHVSATPIDVVMVGRGDLSLKMGLGYSPHHPAVLAATRTALDAALAADKIAGILVYSEEEAEEWLEFGCKFIICSQPEIALTDFYSKFFASVRRG